MKIQWLAIALLVAQITWAGPVPVAPGLTLAPSILSTPPGGIPDATCANGTLRCLIFSGTITADPFGDAFLNAISVTFSPPTALLSSIDAFFFSNVPGLLLSTDPAYTGPIFALDVSSLIAPGTYSGTLTLLGGSNESARAPLASAPFQVVVATPEPGPWLLIGVSLITLGLHRRRA